MVKYDLFKENFRIRDWYGPQYRMVEDDGTFKVLDCGHLCYDTVPQDSFDMAEYYWRYSIAVKAKFAALCESCIESRFGQVHRNAVMEIQRFHYHQHKPLGDKFDSRGWWRCKVFRDHRYSTKETHFMAVTSYDLFNKASKAMSEMDLAENKLSATNEQQE
jgi:hypothetical protein